MQLETLHKLLGGRALLGRSALTEESLIALVREGLPYASFENVVRELDMTIEEATTELGLQRRTMGRRKREGERLKQGESERVMRLGRLAVLAQDVLGGREKAFRWLRKPNRALGGVAPISMLDVDLGARQVEQLLGRIQYGVYS